MDDLSTTTQRRDAEDAEDTEGSVWRTGLVVASTDLRTGETNSADALDWTDRLSRRENSTRHVPGLLGGPPLGTPFEASRAAVPKKSPSELLLGRGAIAAQRTVCVSASLRLCVSASPRLRVSASLRLRVSASPRLRVSALSSSIPARSAMNRPDWWSSAFCAPSAPVRWAVAVAVTARNARLRGR